MSSGRIARRPGEQIIRRTHAERPSHPVGALHEELEPHVTFDEEVAASLGVDLSDREQRRVAFTGSGVRRLAPDDDFAVGLGIGDQSGSSGVTSAPHLHVLFLDWQFVGLAARSRQSIRNSETMWCTW